MRNAALFLCLVFPSVAESTVLYQNGPDISRTQVGSCAYNTECGGNADGGTFAGQLFTLQSESVVTSLDFYSIVYGGVDYLSSINYLVLSAPNDIPGQVVASGEAVPGHSPGPSGVADDTVEYAITLPQITLSQGIYLIAFQGVTANRFDYLSKGVASSGSFESIDGGKTFKPPYDGSIPSVAITVNGLQAAVPEPSTWISVVLGFSFIGKAIRCRRERLVDSRAII